MSPERCAEALGAAFGDRIEALELSAMVVRQGLREILVCVADGVLAVVAPLAEPVPREAWLAELGGIRRRLMRGRGIRSITR